jgi:hypothetical protein
MPSLRNKASPRTGEARYIGRDLRRVAFVKQSYVAPPLLIAIVTSWWKRSAAPSSAHRRPHIVKLTLGRS